jgi:four helix bundle protein
MSESSTSRERLPYAKSFFELVVYQKSRELAQVVFNVTKRFPREEAFSLTDQWRRAARSIGGQIAEAWAKRRYPKHFISKLTDADGEQLETQHWTTTARDCGYLSQDEVCQLIQLAQEIGRMLGTMITTANQFCQDDSPGNLREEVPPYLSESPSTPAHCPLTTAHCPLPTDHCPLTTDYCPLITDH